jgi:hypothetical protein
LFLRRDSSCQFLQRVSNPIDKRQARAEKRHSIRSLYMKSQKRKKSQGEKREEPGDGARRGKKRRGRAEKEHRGAEIHHLHHHRLAPGCPTHSSFFCRTTVKLSKSFFWQQKIEKDKMPKGSKGRKGKHDTTYSPYTYLSTNK